MTSEEDDQEDEMDRFALAGVRSAIEGEGFPAICGGVFLLCSLNERVTPLGFLYVRLWWHLLFVDVGVHEVPRFCAMFFVFVIYEV